MPEIRNFGPHVNFDQIVKELKTGGDNHRIHFQDASNTLYVRTSSGTIKDAFSNAITKLKDLFTGGAREREDGRSKIMNAFDQQFPHLPTKIKEDIFRNINGNSINTRQLLDINKQAVLPRLQMEIELKLGDDYLNQFFALLDHQDAHADAFANILQCLTSNKQDLAKALLSSLYTAMPEQNDGRTQQQADPRRQQSIESGSAPVKQGISLPLQNELSRLPIEIEQQLGDDYLNQFIALLDHKDKHAAVFSEILRCLTSNEPDTAKALLSSLSTDNAPQSGTRTPPQTGVRNEKDDESNSLPQGTGRSSQAASKSSPTSAPDIRQLGLGNPSVDCYANSTLQLLRAFGEPFAQCVQGKSPLLDRFLKNQPLTEAQAATLRHQLKNLMDSTEVGGFAEAQPGKSLKQQDAGEYLRKLMDTFSSELGTSYPGVIKVNQNVLVKKTGLPDRNSTEHLSEAILELALNTTSNNIQDLLDDYLETETMKDMWYDSENKDTEKIFGKADLFQKQFEFALIPETLTVTLKRTKFDMNEFEDNPAGYKPPKDNRSIDLFKGLQLRDSGNNHASYAPVALVIHHGDFSTSGHYTCYRNINNEWFHFNDLEVTRATQDEVMAAALNDAYAVHFQKI